MVNGGVALDLGTNFGPNWHTAFSPAILLVLLPSDTGLGGLCYHFGDHGIPEKEENLFFWFFFFFFAFLLGAREKERITCDSFPFVPSHKHI